MIKLQKNNDTLLVTSEDKLNLFYDLFGLTYSAMLGVMLLIAPKLGKTLVGTTDLASAWYRVIGGMIFCLLMLFTLEYIRIWTFDKASSSFTLKRKTLIHCWQLKTPLNSIESVKITYLKNGDLGITIDILEASSIEIRYIPTQEIDEYAKTINDFLGLT